MFNQKLQGTVAHKISSLFVISAVLITPITTILLVPESTFAATVLPLESFGTGSTANDIPNWDEDGSDDNSTRQVAQEAAVSGEDTASPNGGRFAKIGRAGSNDGWICRTINATGFFDLQMSYFWRGDNDAESSDDGIVEVKDGSGSCEDTSGWITVQTHDLSIDNSWSTQSLFDLPSNLDNGSFRIRFRNNASNNDEYFRVDGISIVEQDVCANVAGNQTITPCADTICVIAGGTWNGTSCDMPVIDVCPNVTGTQAAGPCADTTCIANGGLWSDNTCIPDACANVSGHQESTPCADQTCTQSGGVWEGNQCTPDACANVSGHQSSTPCADETCAQGGGFWNGSTCIPDACSQVSGFQEEGPCANDTCVNEGGTWNGSSCDMPIDVCASVEGLQVNGPCANDTCTQGGGLWENNQCTSDACLLVTGHQPAGPCLNDSVVSPNSWNTQNQTCDAPPACPEGQVGTYPDCTIPEPEVCPEGTAGVYPTCVPLVISCPEGTTGVFPICTPIPTDVCPNDEGVQTNVEQCTPVVVDACPSMEGTQTSVEECPAEQTCNEGQHLEGEQCVADTTPTETPTSGGGGGGGGNPFAACMNGVDDDNDGLTDTTDPGCVNSFDGNEYNEPTTGGSTGTSTATSTGSVLGTETVKACDARFTKFVMQSDLKNADTQTIVDLQMFLNEHMEVGLTVNGKYDAATIKAVKAFQIKHKKDALEVWPTVATGNFYLTTQWIANKVNCESQGLSWNVALPTLSVFKKTK